MFIRTTAAVLAVTAALVSLACGCVSRSEYGRVHDQLLASQADAERLATINKDLQTASTARDAQIRTLQTLGAKRLEKLYHVERIEIGRHSSGVDTDDKAGSDAVRVYLRPIDQHGSVIKAAGAVRVRLFDLAVEGENLIGTYEWTVDELAGQWADLMMSHYSLTCKWPNKAPTHEEVTVRVEFTDYLTGRELTAQKVCKIKLLPAK